jgi:GDP-mannose 6-dehydrogenase
MRISIFGLGYVGAVTGACLASHGHSVVGVDINQQKVEDFSSGHPSIIEPGMEALLATAKEKGLLKGTQDCCEAIRESDVSFVCVGTPSTASGALDLSYVRQVSEEIAGAIRKKGTKHYLILRSTMLPGSTEKLMEVYFKDLLGSALLEVYYFPEFLREGTAIKDFEKPALVVVGTSDGLPPSPEMEPIFGLQVEVVKWCTAELIKYGCNAFHALKISFANEIGRLGKELGLDALSVMRILCRDTKLNISSAYLRPGNPFGGSCLPKDVRALTDCARRNGVSMPIIENLISSNQQHLSLMLKLVESSGCREVVILGLSFKSNTDDLRESPMVEVAQILLGRGYEVRIFDPLLNVSALLGSNKRLIDVRMPHLASLLKPTLSEAVGERGMIIASQPCVPLDELKKLVRAEHQILDVNGWTELQVLPAQYHGFCWELN